MPLVEGIRSLLKSGLDLLVDPSTINPREGRPLNLVASPGLATLLDVALYQSHEGEITATVCASNVVLMALLELKKHSGLLLREVTLRGKTYEEYDASSSTTTSKSGKDSSNKEAASTAQAHALADLTESFARSCLDTANEAIDKLVSEPLAETANLDPAGRTPTAPPPPTSPGDGSPTKDSESRPSMGKKSSSKSSSSSNFWLDAAGGGTGADSAASKGGGSYGIPPARRAHQLQRKDCWESPRLFCPDYVWADDVISSAQRLIRNLVKHRFVTAHIVPLEGGISSGVAGSVRLPPSVANAADAVLLLLRHDLPAKLHQFRVAAEADGVVTKRLYLVKCEYRAPFRAFLEAHQSVQRAPSMSTVDACLALYKEGDKEGLHRRKQATERAVQDALHHPKLVNALEYERRVEEVEIGMARMLLPFTELARFMDNRRARLKAIPDVVAAEDLPALEELLRRLKPMLCRKGGSELRTGIRPLLLDLQGIPRDTKLSSADIFPFGNDPDVSREEATRLRVDVLLSQLQTLIDICSAKGGMSMEKSGGSDVPHSITRGLAIIDPELFQAQHEDWTEMVMEQRKLDAAPGPSFAELSEVVQRAEIDAGVTVAPRQQLDMLRERLDLLEKDRVKRFEVLQETAQEICLREMDMEIDLTAPDQDVVLELPEMSAFGLFGLQLNMVEEPIPLG